MIDLSEVYNAKLQELMANRDERFGRCPKDVDLEYRICDQLWDIFQQMTPDEQASVKRPEPPRIKNSLIAQDEYGRLIGYEDLDDY